MSPEASAEAIAKQPQLVESTPSEAPAVMELASTVAEDPQPTVQGESSPTVQGESSPTVQGESSTTGDTQSAKDHAPVPVPASEVDPARRSARLAMKRVTIGKTPFAGLIADHIHADGQLDALGDIDDLKPAPDSLRLLFTQSSTEDELEVNAMELLKDYLHPDDLLSSETTGVGDRKYVPPGKQPAPTRVEDALADPDFNPATKKEWGGLSDRHVFDETEWLKIPIRDPS